MIKLFGGFEKERIINIDNYQSYISLIECIKCKKFLFLHVNAHHVKNVFVKIVMKKRN